MTDQISNWEITDIPMKLEVKLNYESDPITEEITLITELMGRMTEEIYSTREDHIRNGLIDLGWLPPELHEALNRNLELAEKFIPGHNWPNYQAACEIENERRTDS